MVQRFVAPVAGREVFEIRGSALLSDHVGSELVSAEDVIPVRMRQDDVTWPRDAVAAEEDQERAGVRRR
jgi:hypothetical protein